MNLLFKRLSILFLVLIHLPLDVMAYLKIGDQIQIGDDHYEIIEMLGKGGFKKAFKANKHNCHINCAVVIATSDPFKSLVMDYQYPLLDEMNASPSIHLRREYPMVRAKIKDLPGETYVTVMEYGAGNLQDAKGLSKVSMRLLIEDAYSAISAMNYAQAVNTDIKPPNMVIMGPEISDQSIKSGQAYLALADHDFLYQEGYRIGKDSVVRTETFEAPEFLRRGYALDNKSALFQVSASFYYKLTGRSLFRNPERLNDSFHDSMGIQIAQNEYQTSLKEVSYHLDNIIREHKIRGENEEVEAMEDIKKFILNGMQPNPDARKFWPDGVKKIYRPIISPQHRLTIATDLSARRLEQVNFEELDKLFNEDGTIRRTNRFKCPSIGNVLDHFGRLLDDLF